MNNPTGDEHSVDMDELSGVTVRSTVRSRAEAQACDDEAQFEEFDETVAFSDLYVIVFTDNVDEQRVWYSGSVSRGCVHRPEGRPNVSVQNPVVMSPAYKGFAVEPYEDRYLHYRRVGIVFSRPYGANFMQPSIDTLLVCHALYKMFEQANRQNKTFPKIIDVGAGSGFIGKFAAVYAPGAQEVCLADLDPHAKEYWATPQFGSGRVTAVRGVRWDFQSGDACQFLERNPGYDLIISNPPYIPTEEEVSNLDVSHVESFWEGCGLLMYILGLMERGKYPDGAHLVVAITSLSLRSRQLHRWLDEAPAKGIRVNILHEREIAWKAWYAGRGSGPSFLSASAEEQDNRTKIGENEFFVGYSEPNRSRDRAFGGFGEKDSIGPRANYNWHVAYILDIWDEKRSRRLL